MTDVRTCPPAVRMCRLTGKRMMTRRQAGRAAAWWRKACLISMTSYRCRACSSWHVGGDLRKPRGAR